MCEYDENAENVENDNADNGCYIADKSLVLDISLALILLLIRRNKHSFS